MFGVKRTLLELSRLMGATDAGSQRRRVESSVKYECHGIRGRINGWFSAGGMIQFSVKRFVT